MPLILSLQLSPEADDKFNRLRERYFPPALNYIPAHVTMFHHLPDNERHSIEETLERETSAQAPMPVTITGLRNLGRGVAFTLESPRLSAFRQALRERWHDWLTPQDRQKFNPHITVQNKVQVEVARQTLAELQAAFIQQDTEALGVHLWAYRSGPWEHLHTFPFAYGRALSGGSVSRGEQGK